MTSLITETAPFISRAEHGGVSLEFLVSSIWEHLCQTWCQCGKVRNRNTTTEGLKKDQRAFYMAEALRLCHGVPQDVMQRNG